MSERDKAIIMAYTGFAFLAGDKLETFYQYCHEKLGRPVFTHELAKTELWEELKKASEEDFFYLMSELAK